MAAYILSDTNIYVGGDNVTTFTGSFSTEMMTTMVDGPVLGGGGFMRRYPGLKASSTQISGFADYDADAIARDFGPAQLGSQQLVTVVPAGVGVAGDVALFGRQLIQNIAVPGGAVGDMASFEMSLESDSAWINGLVAAPMAARTTTANGTILTMTGPTAAQRVYVGVNLIAASGTTPSMTVALQSATLIGFGSPTTRATLTAMTAVGWQFASVAGSITDGFWRATFTITGTTPSLTAAVVVGVA